MIIDIDQVLNRWDLQLVIRDRPYICRMPRCGELDAFVANLKNEAPLDEKLQVIRAALASLLSAGSEVAEWDAPILAAAIRAIREYMAAYVESRRRARAAAPQSQGPKPVCPEPSSRGLLN